MTFSTELVIIIIGSGTAKRIAGVSICPISVSLIGCPYLSGKRFQVGYVLSVNCKLDAWNPCRNLATPLVRKAQSDKLLSLLTSDESKGKLGKEKRLEIKELVQKLIESGKEQKFQEDLLGGGSWAVKWTSGAFLWQIWTGPGQVFRTSENKACQSFDPETRTALNEGEIFGSFIKITAFGKYYPKNNSLYLPKAIEVEITSGSLEIPEWNLSIPLPINGKGAFCVMYVDNNIRIFRSIGGTLSLQVKDSLLP